VTEHHHRILLDEIEVKLELHEILWFSFLHFFHLDQSNAPMHTAVVRYSPITFRLAEYLWRHFPGYRNREALRSVILDSGQYEEDLGR
jgi:hypothetical protein